MPLQIGHQLGSYEIAALLGKGGMGEVLSRTRFETEARCRNQNPSTDLHSAFVFPEEVFLRGKLGRTFDEYARHVPRWLSVPQSK